MKKIIESGGMLRHTRSWILVVGLALLLGMQGCSGMKTQQPAPTPTAPWVFQVASIFRDLYQRLGGANSLGAAVSDLFKRADGTSCQYLENALICYDPAASEQERVFLAPIGYDVLGIKAVPPSPEIRIFNTFLPTYRDRFFGARYVGKALTEVRFDSAQRRLVQYFEKMAFSIALDDPKAEIKLLPYGSTVFRRDNPAASMPSGSSIGPAEGIDIPSIALLESIGGLEAAGNPLSKPYPVKDAVYEQLFENVLVYIPRDNPSTLRLRDLAVRVGMPSTPPGPQRYSVNDNMVFYATSGNLGYHVPIYFDQFITTRGGRAMSGSPISEPVMVERDGKMIARQCFQNVCLDYDSTPPDGVNVRLAPVGDLYLKQLKPESIPLTLSEKTVTLRTSEQQPSLSNDQQQVIDVLVEHNQTGQPLADVEGTITLTLPSGNPVVMPLPPTNTSGKTHVALKPLSEVGNARIIPYTVCLHLPSGEPVCSMDSFLIWNLK